MIRVVTNALVAKQHAVVIGPPGTAKSMIFKKAAEVLGVSFFSQLMGKYTKPEQVFGPINVKTLRESGDIRFNTKGMLPEAKIAFLDEIWKSSNAILNQLLRVINEREFEDGGQIRNIPLWSVFAASNELPEEEEGLEALYDRFLYRYWQNYISADKWDMYLDEFWRTNQPGFKVGFGPISFEEVEKAHAQLWKVDLSPIKQKFLKVLVTLQDEQHIVVSDRRKGQCMIAVAANTVINNRKVAQAKDLDILQYTIPANEKEFRVINQVLEEVVGINQKILNELTDLTPQLQDILEKCKAENDPEDLAELLSLAKNMKAKVDAYTGNKDPDVKRMLKSIEAILAEIRQVVINKMDL